MIPVAPESGVGSQLSPPHSFYLVGGVAITILTARKTEYKDQVFKSKSEAIFARAIDQNVDRCFCYEPDWTVLPCGYVADFDFVFVVDTPLAKMELQIAVEYKPSMPTKTYKKELLSRFRAIREKEEGFFSTIVHYLLIVGNAYDDKPVVVYSMDDSGQCFVPWPDCRCVKMKQWLVGAKDYRFDLVSSE